MIKDLYVNGCSFTSGHHLPYEKTWPFILSKKLNLDYNLSHPNSSDVSVLVDLIKKYG